jgi:CRP-like cAMP-binding protein
MKLPNIFEADTPPQRHSAGDTIFAEGDKGDCMYVVKEGQVELRVHGKVVEVVGADGFFGEMALIESGPRTATAVAQSDATLIPINARRFEFMVHEVPYFAMHVMKGLSSRLRQIDNAS